MTKKDFVAIAKILNNNHPVNLELRDQTMDRVYHYIRTELADYFEKTNPRFDREKFIDATRTFEWGTV